MEGCSCVLWMLEQLAAQSKCWSCSKRCFSTASQVQNCHSPPGSDLGRSCREVQGPAGFSWKNLLGSEAGLVNKAKLSCICNMKSHSLVTAPKCLHMDCRCIWGKSDKRDHLKRGAWMYIGTLPTDMATGCLQRYISRGHCYLKTNLKHACFLC